MRFMLLNVGHTVGRRGGLNIDHFQHIPDKPLHRSRLRRRQRFQLLIQALGDDRHVCYLAYRLISGNTRVGSPPEKPVTRFSHAILSDLHLTRGPDLVATVEVCTHAKCERCWRLLPDVGTHSEHPTLCGQCVEAAS